MSSEDKSTREHPPGGLPPGYRILNDGPGREVLTRDEWEEGYVFPTIAEARDFARYLEAVTA